MTGTMLQSMGALGPPSSGPLPGAQNRGGVFSHHLVDRCHQGSRLVVGQCRKARPRMLKVGVLTRLHDPFGRIDAGMIGTKLPCRTSLDGLEEPFPENIEHERPSRPGVAASLPAARQDTRGRVLRSRPEEGHHDRHG